MAFCINCDTKLDEGAKFYTACEAQENRRTFPSEPLSEDDCPQDVRIVSTKPFGLEGEEITLNYIKEKEEDDFRPLNTQIETE
jgi:hypothetical protein